MTKEELIKLSRENLRKSKQGSLCECYDEAFIKGYELSEKRIEDLEKENKVLAQNLEDTEILNKTYEKRFSDLEKENAEMRKQLEMSNKVYNDNLDYSHHIEGQLTKAKELLKDITSSYGSTEVSEAQMYLKIKKAEQFLKDSEVEK